MHVPVESQGGCLAHWQDPTSANFARRATVCSARIAHIFDLRDTAHTANRERSQDSCINFTSLQYLWNFLDGIEINKRNSVEYSAKINNR